MDQINDSATDERDDKEFMATLAKGLAVLGCFGKQRPSMTLSEAASAANYRAPPRGASCAR